MWPFGATLSRKDATHNVATTQMIPVLDEPSSEPAAQLQQADHPTEAQTVTSTRLEWTGSNDERLGIVFPLRALLLMSASFLSGASLGVAKGSSIAADRYRAENAHRLPTNQNGWFLYHKSKNYHAMLGGMKEGAKFGSVLTGWAFMFMVTEEVVDQSRARVFARRDDERASGQRDTASTVISAMTVAGVYSWKQGFDQIAAARTAKMALKASLLYGLVQDALATIRGNRPAYVEWITRKTFWPSTNLEDA